MGETERGGAGGGRAGGDRGIVHRWVSRPRPWSAALAVALAVSATVAGAAAWPAAGDEPVPAPLRVAVVGDSLVFQSAHEQAATLDARGWTGTVSGNPGQAVDAPAVVEDLEDAAASDAEVVVIATATNDNVAVASRAAEIGFGAALDEYRGRLAATLDRFGDRCVVVVNASEDIGAIYSPWAVPAVDAALADVTADAGGVVVDWNRAAAAHPEWFGPDHLHFEGSADPAAGASAYASAIASGVEACAGPPSR